MKTITLENLENRTLLAGANDSGLSLDAETSDLNDNNAVENLEELATDANLNEFHNDAEFKKTGKSGGSVDLLEILNTAWSHKDQILSVVNSISGFATEAYTKYQDCKNNSTATADGTTETSKEICSTNLNDVHSEITSFALNLVKGNTLKLLADKVDNPAYKDSLGKASKVFEEHANLFKGDAEKYADELITLLESGNAIDSKLIPDELEKITAKFLTNVNRSHQNALKVSLALFKVFNSETGHAFLESLIPAFKNIKETFKSTWTKFKNFVNGNDSTETTPESTLKTEL